MGNAQTGRLTSSDALDDVDPPPAFALLRRERPHRRRAAEQRDELAAFLIELHSVPSQGPIAEYPISEDQSGGNGDQRKARQGRQGKNGLVFV